MADNDNGFNPNADPVKEELKSYFSTERLSETFKKGKVKRVTPEVKQRFLVNYARWGFFGASARAAGVSAMAIRDHLEQDPEFAEMYKEARELYCNRLEAEIHRRAVEGVLEPVVSKGEIVTYQRKYDTRLLEMQAKRFIPDYNEKLTHDHNVSGGVLVVTGGQSVQDWAEQYGGKKREPAPEESPEDDG